MKKTFFSLAIAAIVVFGAGSPVSAAQDFKGYRWNIVPVDSCATIDDGVNITRFERNYNLTHGIKDAGHGLRDYYFRCHTDTSYKVWFKNVKSPSTDLPTVVPVSPFSAARCGDKTGTDGQYVLCAGDTFTFVAGGSATYRYGDADGFAFSVSEKDTLTFIEVGERLTFMTPDDAQKVTVTLKDTTAGKVQIDVDGVYVAAAQTPPGTDVASVPDFVIEHIELREFSVPAKYEGKWKRYQISFEVQNESETDHLGALYYGYTLKTAPDTTHYRLVTNLGLEAGSSLKKRFIITIPVGPNGVEITADPMNSILEGDEENNSTYKGFGQEPAPAPEQEVEESETGDMATVNIFQKATGSTIVEGGDTATLGTLLVNADQAVGMTDLHFSCQANAVGLVKTDHELTPEVLPEMKLYALGGDLLAQVKTERWPEAKGRAIQAHFTGIEKALYANTPGFFYVLADVAADVEHEYAVSCGLVGADEIRMVDRDSGDTVPVEHIQGTFGFQGEKTPIYLVPDLS